MSGLCMGSPADCGLRSNPSPICSKLFRGHLGQLEKVKGEEPDLKKELPARLKARLSCPGQTKVSCTSMMFPHTWQYPKGIQTFVDDSGTCSFSWCWCACTCSKPSKQNLDRKSECERPSHKELSSNRKLHEYHLNTTCSFVSILYVTMNLNQTKGLLGETL